MNDFPEAHVHEQTPMRGWLRQPASRLWLLTGLCLLLAIALLISAVRQSGTLITIRFQHGHGIKVGDTLRHRGIEVGEVTAVQLHDDLGRVNIQVALAPAAAGLARAGSRFWVERPRLSLSRISGLETVMGAKYLGVLPGPADAAPQVLFDGDESPLIVLDAQVREIEVRFREGHGLQVGHELRHRGIVVGEVASVELNEELSGVTVRVRLAESAHRLARAGSQFWVARPDVSLAGIRGLETIVEGRYLAVLPGPDDADPLTVFDGIETAPTILDRVEGSLEIMLESPHRHGVQPGAPVLYRGHQIGRIAAVSLSPDASRMESRAQIDPGFKRLVRDNSVFWSSSGIKANFSLSGGFEVSAATLATIAAGGVSLATPEVPGKPVNTGHRFALSQPGDRGYDEEQWSRWQPHIPLGSIELPEGMTLPTSLRAALTWQEKRFGLTRSRQREGWIVALDDQRLLGPADLLLPPPSAIDGEAKLQLAGRELPVRVEHIELNGKLATLQLNEPLANVVTWPASRLRQPQALEEVFVVAETIESSFSIPMNRLSAAVDAGEWEVAPSFTINPQMHGACVISPKDGQVLGLVVLEQGQSQIALAPR